MLRRYSLLAGVPLLALALSCQKRVYPASFARTNDLHHLDVEAPFLKCHMKDGRVIVLQHWNVDVPQQTVTGDGIAYDASRTRTSSGPQTVPMDGIALFETNKPEKISGGGVEIGVMVVGSIASAAMTVACITNPKACFGSCPTFFASDGEGTSLQAEGFSAAIAHSLEETDVDAMWTARATAGRFDVLMTNDAFETHAVDSVRLLAAPRPPGTRVLRAADAYYVATRIDPPMRATAASGDVTEALRATDKSEYHSLASPENLGEKETAELVFPRPHGRGGVLIVARNSLMSTFLFYQELAYMGHSAGDWIAMLERQGKEPFARTSGMLGGIVVSVQSGAGDWVRAGEHYEVGPIAKESQLVPLPEAAMPASGDVHVRLEMARGAWRVDQVSLATLGDPVDPVALEPVEVVHEGKTDARALEALRPSGEHLFTYPGDEYTLHFELPTADAELFLESRGYYYEWMREAWMKEDNQVEALRMIVSPERALVRLAPKYKAVEGEMDRIFWESRYTKRGEP